MSFPGRGDKPCNGFKDGAACDSLRNNCITLGNAIFCDYDYVLFLRHLAQASFGYAHMALATKPDARIETVSFAPFSFELLVDFATYQAAPKPRTLGGSIQSTPGMTPSVGGAIRYSRKYHSVIAESAEFAVVGAVIGHETAHVESNACPIDHGERESGEKGHRHTPTAPRQARDARLRQDAAELGIVVFSRDEANEVARKYMDMTCHKTLSHAELAADLRGIEMLGTVLTLQNWFKRLGYLDAEADRARAELWRLKTGVAVIGLAQALEYQLIVSAEPREAIARVKGEPWSMNWAMHKKYVYQNKAMYEYYRSLAYERTRREFASGSPVRGLRHMHPAYRAGLLLEAVGLQALYDQRRKLGFGIGFPIRLYGYMHGSLQAVQELACSRDPDSANRRAKDFLYKISGVRNDEYLVD